MTCGQDVTDGGGVDMSGLAVRPSEVLACGSAEAPDKLIPRDRDLLGPRRCRRLGEIRVMHRVVADLVSPTLEILEMVPTHDLHRSLMEPLAAPSRDPSGITAVIYRGWADEVAPTRVELLEDSGRLEASQQSVVKRE